MDYHPLVGIITPVNNGGKFLRESIFSVLNQDRENNERIFFDAVLTETIPGTLREKITFISE